MLLLQAVRYVGDAFLTAVMSFLFAPWWASGAGAPVGAPASGFDLNRIWDSRNTTLLLGWLLGLLSAPAIEWVKDRRRKKQLEVAIHHELQEIQYRLALVSFSTELDYGDGFDRDFVVRTKQLIAGYEGAIFDEAMVGKIDTFLAMDANAVAEHFRQQWHEQRKGKVIPTVQARYLDSAMGDLRLLNARVQSALFDILTSINALNGAIEDATYYHRLTFTNLTEQNQAVANQNNVGALRQVARQMRMLAEKIDSLCRATYAPRAWRSRPRAKDRA